MKLAVTGSHGQLARSLREKARSAGISFTSIARPAFDLADEDSVRRAIEALDCDVLVNAAAYTAVDRAERDADTTFRINAEGAGAVARACARRAIPVIHISTDYVFDGTKAEPYLETDLPRPLNVYGRSKLAGEELVAHGCAKHIIVRTAWVHSPFASNFVKTMLQLGGERGEIAVVSDQMGSPTYALHLAEALTAIAQRLIADPASVSWGIYHCSDAGVASRYELACVALAESESRGGPAARVCAIPSSEYPPAASRPLNASLDTGKISKAFGISPPHWRIGVAECVARLLAPHGEADNPAL